MTQPNRIVLIGNTPSPYTKKMVSLLRYRRIPYTIIWDQPKVVLERRGVALPKVELLPTFIFEDADEPYAMVDSTPIIRKLEADYSGRSVLPSQPALAFIDYLLEDFADEWATKYMFHYRWYFAEDAKNAGGLLPFCIDPKMSEEQHQWADKHFSQRQIERLYVVGSNEVTAPIIDASYRRFLKLFDAHLVQNRFLLGERPAASDFALFGQLSQLVGFDPTPRAITHQESLRAVAWTLLVDDLSGLEPSDSDWLAVTEPHVTLRGILGEVGRVYTPALLANAKAFEQGESEWEAEIDGAIWAQKTFPYQVKCLQWINQEYQKLNVTDRDLVDKLLSGTGCEAMLLTGET